VPMRSIHVNLCIPPKFYNRAVYVFRIFSSIWGVPVRFVDGVDVERTDIRYGRELADTDLKTTVWIPFDEAGFLDHTCYESKEDEGRLLWKRQGGVAMPFDVVASSCRLLLLSDEVQIAPAARDRRGIFCNDGLPAARKAIEGMPVVEHHAAYLLERVRCVNPGLAESRMPKWPGAKKFAIVLTHDTDAVHLGGPLEMAANLAKYVLRRDRDFLQMFRMGWQGGRDVARSPFFAFPQWRQWEEDRQMRSCFFLFVNTDRTKRDINDCKSSVVSSPVPWDVLRQLASDGWEFGLHASINAKRKLDSFLNAKRYIEEKLESPIYGLRHHYWALDWLHPHHTFRKHVNAGFRYDTSIAWRTREGLRAAMCHPYQPFDPAFDRPLNLLELPTCLMDGHVANQPDAVERGRRIIQSVRDCGGVAVLDWHTETGCNSLIYKGYVALLAEILKPFLDSGDAWLPTPWELVRYWHQRETALAGAAND
jgi:hypothetical protein